jgi:N-acetylglucosaminyldiphosphoundecaprenol N-acetyl-beta-D-mannosaminyltransferase
MSSLLKKTKPLPKQALEQNYSKNHNKYDEIKIGSVVCQFITSADFAHLCRKWLTQESFHHVITLNPEMVMQANSNIEFQVAINKADISIPDGAGIIWARWYLRSNFWSLLPSLLCFPFIKVDRVSGIDAIFMIAHLCSSINKSIYLIGGTNIQISGAAKVLRKKYPHLTLYTAPYHRAEKKGPRALLMDIARAKPDVVFVAYGAPMQSIWIQNHKKLLSNTKIAMGVGGAFAMLSEQTPRAPKIFQKLNIEWLWRLMLQPSRLPRIWRATIQFPRMIHKQKYSSKQTFDWQKIF